MLDGLQYFVIKTGFMKRWRKTTLSKIAIIDIDNTLWQFSDAFYLELKNFISLWAIS